MVALNLQPISVQTHFEYGKQQYDQKFIFLTIPASIVCMARQSAQKKHKSSDNVYLLNGNEQDRS